MSLHHECVLHAQVNFASRVEIAMRLQEVPALYVPYPPNGGGGGGGGGERIGDIEGDESLPKCLILRLLTALFLFFFSFFGEFKLEYSYVPECQSYVLVCYSYVPVCTRMFLVCDSYVLVCTRVPVCHWYVNRVLY